MASPSPLPHSPPFTPIPENEEEERQQQQEQEKENEHELELKKQQQKPCTYKHTPTPLHPSTSNIIPSTPAKKPPTSKKNSADNDDTSVSCNKCRPSSRDKISIVPLDVNGHKNSFSPSNPNGVLRSLFSSLTRRSPASTATNVTPAASREADEWRRAAAELSRKLIQTTRKRDEALHEASKLKYSLAELDRKVDRLEAQCRELTAALDRSSAVGGLSLSETSRPFTVEVFARAVSDARTAVRNLGRSLAAQIRLGSSGPRSTDRISALIQPYDPRAAAQWRKNPASGVVLFYMEALLNRVFFSGFESDENEVGSIDPLVRCEMSRAEYEAIRELVWDDVLSKGTRHFSEGLSRFCDRKMSEVVAMMGWARAWPEALLESFFGAAKGVMVVRLMARSVFPAIPMLKVDRVGRFDGRFMEDVAADRVRNMSPVSVRLMVAPGFHVYPSGARGIVKCKVLCAYNNSNDHSSSDGSANV